MINTAMLEPVIDALTDNLAVIIPVGIVLFGIVLGIRFIPILFRMFTRG